MAFNTIKLKKYSNVIEEITATAVAITPGSLLELTSGDEVQVHATAERNVLPMFALEDELQGNGIDDNYAVSAKIQVWIPGRGDIVYAILKDDTAAVVIGDFLESAGGGLLQLHVEDVESWDSASVKGTVTVYSETIVGVALEAVDLSGSSGEESSGALGYNKRIKVRII